MGDLITHPVQHIKYIADFCDLIVPYNFDYGFIKKDADIKRLNEYLNVN